MEEDFRRVEERMSAREYVENVFVPALSHATAVYFPFDKDVRRQGITALAHDLGACLTAWPRPEVEKVMGGLYTTVLMKFCFDRTGPVVNAAEFFNLVREGYDKYLTNHPHPADNAA